MTKTKKNEIIDSIINLLIQLTNDKKTIPTAQLKPVEMLTVKECTEACQGAEREYCAFTCCTGQGEVYTHRTE